MRTRSARRSPPTSRRAASHPEVALALRDGYAVRADATTDATSYTPLPLSPAPPRIGTGERMPADTDAVAALDAVSMQGKTMQALAAVAPGEGVLPAGADATPGVILKMTGGRLRRIDVAALLALGIERVPIREPRLRVVRAGGGEIIGAAASLIASAIEAEGGVACNQGRYTRSRTERRRRRTRTLTPSSRSAAPARAPTTKACARSNAPARSRSTASASRRVRPPRSATIGSRPVLLLPGRLDAALAGWLTVGRRMLARLAFRLIEEQPFSAELSEKVASPLCLAEVVPVRRRGFRIEPLASHYLPMQVLTRADGWILVPADSEGYQAGTSVPVRPWP